jgi:hypothetical protein
MLRFRDWPCQKLFNLPPIYQRGHFDEARGKFRQRLDPVGLLDLGSLMRVRALGASRCGASDTVAILDEYRRREAAGQ